jgi:hypothetical protein
VKTIILSIIIIVLSGCGVNDPKETKKFTLSPSGGYRGRPVGANSQQVANEVCQEFDYLYAVEWDIRTVHVTGSFWGDWYQDVMYSVTCAK